MSSHPLRIRVLKLAIVLTALFNLLAVLVLVSGTPRLFAAFMFVGETMFALGLILLVVVILLDLRTKELL